MDIKPIETIYDGYKFRSRLEARWAVFFNAANIEYRYEPEGFVGIGGEPYLPDFYLPKFGVYAEVKGTEEDLYKCSVKIGECIDFGASDISEKGLLLLGNIPYKADSFPYFPLLTWECGVIVRTAVFDIYGKEPYLYRSDCEYDCDIEHMYFNGIGLPRIEGAVATCDIPEGVTLSPRYVSAEYSGVCSEPYFINECYKKARQARFEHGEMPQINKF
jgi:hypothetical protein